MHGFALKHLVPKRCTARSCALPRECSQVPPNNRGFESFPYRTAADALHTLESLGVGFGTQGATPGAFYGFPGTR